MADAPHVVTPDSYSHDACRLTLSRQEEEEEM